MLGWLIDSLIQIPQNSGGGAPDVRLAERHGVVVSLYSLPVAGLAMVIGGLHQAGERHLESVGDLAGLEREPVVRRDAGQRRQDAKALEGEIEIEIADRVDTTDRQADLPLALRPCGD